MKTAESRLAWALLAPALTVLGVFGIFPIGYALFVSLHRWRLKKGDFVAFDHYRRALGEAGFVGLVLLAAAAWLLVVWLARRRRSHRERQHKLLRAIGAGLGLLAALAAVCRSRRHGEYGRLPALQFLSGNGILRLRHDPCRGRRLDVSGLPAFPASLGRVSSAFSTSCPMSPR